MNTIPLDEAAAVLHRMMPDETPNWRRRIFGPDYVLDRAKELAPRPTRFAYRSGMHTIVDAPWVPSLGRQDEEG
jgi:hypothetical protein